jgi:hypothetical protein
MGSTCERSLNTNSREKRMIDRPSYFAIVSDYFASGNA